MCKLTCCRNHLFPLFFLWFSRRCRHASFPNEVAARTTRHNNQFGVEAAVPTALMPTMMLIVAHHHLVRRVSPIAWYKSLGIPTYNTIHNQPTTSVDASWPKWPAAAAMMPHPWHWCIQQLPRMLADCCMWWHWEWGTMAAVGRRRPPRLAGHGFASFS